jgi:hypothetical protein
VRHRTVFVPILMPKLSDQAASHLIDILEQLLGIAGHHYGEQAHRWRRRQRRAKVQMHTPSRSLFDDQPF